MIEANDGFVLELDVICLVSRIDIDNAAINGLYLIVGISIDDGDGLAEGGVGVAFLLENRLQLIMKTTGHKFVGMHKIVSFL